MANKKQQPNQKKKKKFTLYSFFNPEGNGKGLSKEQAAQPRDFTHFFSFFWTNIGLIFSVNMLMVLGNFPLLFTLFGLTGNLNTHTAAAASVLFAPLYGTMQFQASPVTAALFGVHGVQTSMSIVTLPTKIMYGIGLLAIITFGLVNVGTTYILRNVVKGEPTFLWHDFLYAIKKNWKQGILIGVLDLIMLAVMTFDVIFFAANAGSVLHNILLTIMLVMVVVYLMMRFYIYILIVTFDLSFFKLVKNSFIFALLGMKRNMLALLGIAAITVLNYSALLVIMPLGIILPFVITFSLGTFMAVYAAYPKIKEIMIDPYYESDRVNAPELDDIEPIFTDRG